MRCLLDYSLLPFSRGGFSALPAAEAAFEKEFENRSTLDWWITQYPAFPGENRFVCEQVHCARLIILALAMELHRHANGRYPDTLTQLIPAFIPAIPDDLDGAPLRALVTDDAQQAVVYSVGWNLQDDWHGVAPDHAGRNSKPADWFLKLPVSRNSGAP